MKIKLVFAGGGTGGHIYPVIAVIRQLKKLSQKDIDFYFVMPKREECKDLSQEEKIKTKRIISGKLYRYFTAKNLLSPLKILIGLIQSLSYLSELRPALVFLKGGYGALPVGLGALILKIPIVVHESDSYPGLVTKLFSRWAKLVLISFEETKNYLMPSSKIYLVGNPVRQFKAAILNSGKLAKKELKLNPDKKTILILGGSQGAAEINELIFNTAERLLVKFSLIHAVGKDKFSGFRKKAKKIKNSDYKVYPYLNEETLELALRASDLVISRAGSSLIFEIAQAGKPSILIPLMSSAADHQRKNAYAYMKAGACLVIERPNLKQNIFLKELIRLTDDKEKMMSMSRAALNFSKPKAAKKIAKTILSTINCQPLTSKKAVIRR